MIHLDFGVFVLQHSFLNSRPSCFVNHGLHIQLEQMKLIEVVEVDIFAGSACQSLKSRSSLRAENMPKRSLNNKCPPQ
jgi:hypothetical protein